VFLRSLTLKGFKSFAEPSTLEFEPGVTVVVGPNGSGKSNIVDAVAWVLGAQGPRALRSAKMEDVIFAGTAKRPPLGRAEVSLTIDNSAKLLPIDFTEVRLTRTLWRNGDSEYSINGAPCRLLDVQELLSDTGVGRQQHTIISQAQLDLVLSARPEERRAVIEEAAGISKHRRRKEKAERRLEATEAALVRAQDLLREVRRQLRPLERQAEAARRHGALTEELRGLRSYLYGHEFSAIGARCAAVSAAKAERAASVDEALGALGGLDAAVAAAEANLDEVRKKSAGADLGEAVSMAEGLRGRASGLLALLQERRRSVERERAAGIDQDLVSSLEAEAAALSFEIASSEREAAGLLPEEERLRREEDELEAEALALPSPPPASPPPAPAAAARAAEARAELVALRHAGSQGQLEAATARVDAVRAREARLRDEAEQARSELGRAAALAPSLQGAASAAEERLGEAEAALAASQAERRRRDSEQHRWAARAEALSQALDEARARAGARRLAGVPGMVGALVELVEVEGGLEAAFEAAAGEALSAVLMAGEEAAFRGLEELAAQGAPGAVIALREGAGQPAMPASAAPAGAAPTGAAWLRPLVRSTDEGVSELLDRLLGAAVVTEAGSLEAARLAASRPDLLVVTTAGDRFAGGIWRTGAHGTGATGAALAEARERLEGALAAGEAAARAELQAAEALERARSQSAFARGEFEANEAARAAAARAAERAALELAVAEEEGRAAELERSELELRARRDAARVHELELLLPELEAAAEAEERQALELARARQRVEERRAALATLRHDLEVRATSIEERRAVLGRRLEEVERRLEGYQEQRAAAGRRRAELEASLVALDRLRRFVEERLAGVEASLSKLREMRAVESEALRSATEEAEKLRRQRAGVERELLDRRELLSRAELEDAQLQDRMEALRETVRRELDCEPESLLNTECPPMPAGTSASTRVRELERELRLMGPVNPLAMEEYAGLQERHEFLERQLHDVTSARRELAKVIRAVDAEIVTVFKAAYDDVADNFSKLVATLFPGGQGSLSLTEPSDLLGSGVELEVRPVGKNIRRLSLLSGGERSLVALAFLFAVFRSRPAPFYMMDEVESALDDVNLHRFLDLVNEFRGEAQLLIVSHQKRTMEAADCLYGVSMAPGGSSVVVSQKLDRRERAEAVGL
jgi:chromosome segregation protein